MIAAVDMSPRKSWMLLVVLLAVGWLFVGMLELAAYITLAIRRYETIDWSFSLLGLVGFWGLHMALAPLLVWVLSRMPLEQGRIGRGIAWSLSLLPVYISLHFLLRYLWESNVLRPDTASLIQVLLRSPAFISIYFTGTAFVFLVTAGAVNGMEFYLRYRERERAAAALQREKADLRTSLMEARLELLQAQLQPHFLFNALHAISTLILKGEARSANEMLSHLSRFLRMTLDNAESPTVPLAVELEFLDAYLSIQRVRFGDRLCVAMDIDYRARPVAVPNLIFQPLVENSIRHGITSNPGPGLISIRARMQDGMLTLEVEDNGRGLPGEAMASNGIGLGNIRQRLDQLYPGNHTFALEKSATGGALARIVIPACSVADAPEVNDDACRE